MQLKNYPSQHWFKRYIHYNPHTGQFTRIQKSDNGRPVGPMSSQKRSFKLNGEWYTFGTVAWVYMTGERPDTPIRFKNGDSHNLKFDNITLTKLTAYAAKKIIKKGDRWRSYFYMPYDIKQYYAGTYDTEEEARAAAHAAKKLMLKQKRACK